MAEAVLPSIRRAFDFAMVALVQSFMLLQVGFFYALLLWKERRETICGVPQEASGQQEEVDSISIIIPAYNEAGSISRCLSALVEGIVGDQERVEVIVVDAGCRDATIAKAATAAADCGLKPVRTVRSQGGRGPAINAGVGIATGEVILVLHADTLLPSGWDQAVREAFKDPAVLMSAFSFGCDRGQLGNSAAPPAGLSLMEWSVNLRSRWFQLPFGDQALAMTARSLVAAGGYPDWPILEEYDLVNRLRCTSARGGGHIVTLSPAALCSPRRWEKSTVWRVNAVNQAVMLWFRLGATVEQIFEFYYGVPAPARLQKTA